MASEQTKRKLLDYMNTNCTDDPPRENIRAGEVMRDPENIAHGEKMSAAYGLADELLTPDSQQLYWNEETRTWSIGPTDG